MKRRPRSDKRLPDEALFQPKLESVARDIHSAAELVSGLIKRLESLRSGLTAIETAARTFGQRGLRIKDPGSWISRGQAAEMIGVHPTTINIWTKTGLIPQSAMIPISAKRCRYSRVWFEMQKIDPLPEVRSRQRQPPEN